MSREDGVEIINYVRGIRITRRKAKKFASHFPNGRHNPISSRVIFDRIKDHDSFRKIFKGIKNHDNPYIGELSKIALVNYGIGVVGCKRGRFVVVNEEDRDYAIAFLERNKFDKGSFEDGGRRKSSKSYTFRYRALHDLVINGKTRPLPEEKYNDEEGEKMTDDKTQETMDITNDVVEETKEEKYILSEDTCISFNEEMDLIVIRPHTDKKGIDTKTIGEYEISADILSNPGDVIEVAMHIGQKPWMDKEMLLDFIRLALNKL